MKKNWNWSWQVDTFKFDRFIDAYKFAIENNITTSIKFQPTGDKKEFIHYDSVGIGYYNPID